MAVTPSTMLPLGTEAPGFTLPDTVSGEQVSLDNFERGKPLLVVFMCNHCPYVKHVREKFAEIAAEYQKKGVGVVAISANDPDAFPEDGPQQMAALAGELGFTFPYLFDETQETAKAYHAACTPDFFLFDGERRLFYRGQMDSARPGNDQPVTGRDLRSALDAVLAGGSPPEVQRPSMGCNIKWRPGNEPEYFGG